MAELIDINELDNFRRTIDSVIDEKQKDNIDINVYDYIIANKRLLFCEENVELCRLIRYKLHEMHYEKRISWASNYHLLIFGKSLLEDLNGIPDLIEIQN